jgi:WD40 repeat protein
LAIGAYVEKDHEDKVFLLDLNAYSPDLSLFSVADSRPNTFISAIAVNRKGDILVAAFNSLEDETENEVIVWSTGTKLGTARFPTGPGPINLALSQSGLTLAVGEFGAVIRLWDLSKKDENARLIYNSELSESVSYLAMSMDGRFLAAAPSLGEVQVWNLAYGAERSPWSPGGLITGSVLSPGGRYLARIERFRELFLDDLTTRKEHYLGEADPGWTPELRALDRRHLVFETFNGMNVLDVSGREFSKIELPIATQIVSFSKDGRIFAIRGYRKIEIREAGEKTAQAEIPNSESTSVVALHPAATYVAVASLKDNDVEVWALPKHSKKMSPYWIAQLPVRVVESRGLRWSPRGDCLAVTPQKGKALLWKISVRRAVAEIEGNIADLDFSPNGAFLAIASRDAELRVTEGCSHPLWTVKLTQQPARLTFHPDSRIVAVALTDGTVEVWDLLTRQRVAHLGSEGALKDLTFSTDGRYLVTLDSHNTVRQELWRSDDLIRETQRRLDRGALHRDPSDFLSDANSSSADP